jgi:hypothetical protein
MKELVEYIVKGLVDHPDEVTVAETRRGGDVALHTWRPTTWAASSARARWRTLGIAASDGGQRQLASNSGY